MTETELSVFLELGRFEKHVMLPFFYSGPTDKRCDKHSNGPISVSRLDSGGYEVTIKLRAVCATPDEARRHVAVALKFLDEQKTTPAGDRG